MSEIPAAKSDVAGHCNGDSQNGVAHAAVLLVESLIHGLIARSVIDVEQAVEIVEVAIDAGIEISLQHGQSAYEDSEAILLLRKISDSLQHDLPA